MTTDPIRQAIAEAVAGCGQKPSLNDKIVAWFEQLVSGNTSLDDKDAVRKSVELLYDATELSASANSPEGD